MRNLDDSRCRIGRRTRAPLHGARVLIALSALIPFASEAPAQAPHPAPSSHASAVATPTHRLVADSASSRARWRTIAELVSEALDEYRRSGVARPVSLGGMVASPYGHGQPVLTCAVLRACLVELEAGERLVHAPIAGDHARWIVEEARAGADGANAMVAIKPKACGISTNLVLSTDRRVYDVVLASPPCDPRSGRASTEDAAARAVSVRRLRFYYPDDPTPAAAAMRPLAEGRGGRVGSDTASASEPASTVNRTYVVVRARRTLFGRDRARFPWTPSDVRDDGAHVYVVLPPEARQHPAPVLFALEEDGSRSLLNTTLIGDTLVTDRVFRRAALVTLSGGTEQRLVLENRAWGQTPSPSSAVSRPGREP